MPRQSRGSAPPRRPTAAPARPAAPPQRPQQRSASTVAHPPAAKAPTAVQQQAAPPAQSAGPGLFGQMASTAAGVAVGSSIGHAVGGFFGGGSSQAAPEAAQTSPADPYNTNATQQEQSWGAAGSCENDAKSFRSCMDQNKGDLTVCGWYLDQLKACQQAASPY
ncbi:hypothetical protein P152DRAFT_508978 [Eremomyces bilateralis CBS 781.70]|uniref:CHCH domain-containing protein n=1 Tax=Eremomyces bilateralis CBS 781.70 TaxID=1392243 RepID=A0A6G1FVX1_9PEZI|nr:uncharacterized protein P152DRAFT_508978 [Eremomyces bilateralis CBS 781.70]KAF1809868.1 hypothetical protein P152DRAFT_508978 [Eremomyces bilateralis CBS 781.70]